MEYDGLDRLKSAGSCSFGGDCWHRFSYDAQDNLRSWVLPGVRDYASYVYDERSRLTNIRNSAGESIVGLGYDDQGNLENKNGQSYVFDYGNRLREAVGLESYRYDAEGRRVLSLSSDGNTRLLSLYNRDGEPSYTEDSDAGKDSANIFLRGGLLAIREKDRSGGAERILYQHTDALGSPVAVTDAAGQVLSRNEFEPYGKVIDNSAYSGIGYTGHLMDRTTGLIQMQQRYYDPSVGRFLSVDPVAADTGTGANFNRYAYANSNPYRFTDPDGRTPRQDIKDRKDWSSIAAKDSSAATRMATSAGSSGGERSGRQPAGSMSELIQNIAGAVVDKTNMTIYAEVSGAAGPGGTLSFSDSLKTGEKKLELMGALGEGAGAFAGVEVDILTFNVPGAKDAPVFFDSGDVKVGDLVAGGLKIQLNPGGTATLKGFGGLGIGGKGIINKPLSIGTTLWSNKDGD
ncbi:hypothetical protein JHW38_24085 [Lysobacter enzymogenes]|nr:hypothetical protein JHW38_24085 [Lysobacter enzymogenes]